MGRRRRDRRTPFTPISSSGAYVPVRTGPASRSNSNSTHSQTEINRILRYAEPSIKDICADDCGVAEVNHRGAATAPNPPNEAEITGLINSLHICAKNKILKL